MTRRLRVSYRIGQRWIGRFNIRDNALRDTLGWSDLALRERAAAQSA